MSFWANIPDFFVAVSFKFFCFKCVFSVKVFASALFPISLLNSPPPCHSSPAGPVLILIPGRHRASQGSFTNHYSFKQGPISISLAWNQLFTVIPTKDSIVRMFYWNFNCYFCVKLQKTKQVPLQISLKSPSILQVQEPSGCTTKIDTPLKSHVLNVILIVILSVILIVILNAKIKRTWLEVIQ